jgi:hypothetical protein
MASSGMLRRVAFVKTDISHLSTFVFLRSVRRLLVNANVPSLIFVTLKMEALSSFERSVLTTATRRNISEDVILHCHRRENLKSYIREILFHNQRQDLLSLSDMSAKSVLVCAKFEVFTAMAMKYTVFWDVKPCGSCENRCFGGTYLFHHQSEKKQWTKNSVAVTSN